MGRQTKKKKISTTNFRLFITRMDLIGLRCLYTLSLIKLITRNPPWTIVSLSFNQEDDTSNGPFIRPPVSHVDWGSIQHINVIQRFCTLARSNHIWTLFWDVRTNVCVCVCSSVADSIILYIPRVFFPFFCAHLIGSHIIIYCHLMSVDKWLIFYVKQIPNCLMQTKYTVSQKRVDLLEHTHISNRVK